MALPPPALEPRYTTEVSIRIKSHVPLTNNRDFIALVKGALDDKFINASVESALRDCRTGNVYVYTSDKIEENPF